MDKATRVMLFYFITLSSSAKITKLQVVMQHTSSAHSSSNLRRQHIHVTYVLRTVAQNRCKTIYDRFIFLNVPALAQYMHPMIQPHEK